MISVGDCYVAAAGLMAAVPDHAEQLVAFALAMQDEARCVVMPDGRPVTLRIGVHSGRITSGVIGSIRRRYCLFGDTMNTASRMESTAGHNQIQISAATHALLAGCPDFVWRCRGAIPVKGKGEMVTYELDEAAMAEAPPSRSTSGGSGGGSAGSGYRGRG